MTKLLITGSGGFVGSNLAEFFEKKYELLTPRSFQLDLVDAQSLEKFFSENKIDAIIHCASVGGIRGIVDSKDVAEKNISMFENLAECAGGKTPMIVFGSGAQFDKSRELKKISESELGKFIPQDAYGFSKMKIAQKSLSTNNITCLNIFGCYGKNEPSWRFPSYALSRAIKGENIKINRNVIFDYIYIEDLCFIVDAFLKRAPSKRVINITPDKSVEIAEIAELASEIAGSASIEILESGFSFQYTADNSLLKKELPDVHFTSIKEGLKCLYSHLIAISK